MGYLDDESNIIQMFRILPDDMLLPIGEDSVEVSEQYEKKSAG